MKRILGLLCVLMLAGCRPVAPPDRPVTLGIAPRPPDPVTLAEKGVVADVAATGKAVSEKAAESKTTRELWDLLCTWGGPGTVSDVPALRERLTAEVQRREAAFAVFLKLDSEYKDNIRNIEQKNILLAREKGAAVAATSALEKQNAELQEKVQGQNVWLKRLSWAAVGTVAVVWAVAVVFAYIRFGATMGSLVLVVGGLGLVGTVLAIIWQYYRNFAITVMVIVGALIVVGLVAYAVWGAVLAKVFAKQVAAVQEARRVVAHTAEPVLAKVDAAIKANTDHLTGWLVDLVKKRNAIEPVTPTVPAPTAKLET